MEKVTPTLLKEAAEWFAHLQGTDEDITDRAAFDAWLLRSPAHIEAYLRVSQAWGDVGLISGEDYRAEQLIITAQTESRPDNVTSMNTPLLFLRERGKGMGVRRGYLAAAAALVSMIVGTILWLHSSPFTTTIGEQRSIPLSDGSIAYLNTNSELKIRYTQDERRLDLLRGEARFTVAKSASRPFVVTTPQVTVRVLGTIFNVQVSAARTAVTVIEGEVTVAELNLKAGQHALFTNQRAIPNAGPTVERVLAWPQRQLVFREETLADVVAEFNRYHREPIRIEDPALAALRISAVFDSNDSASLIQYLEQYGDVRAERKDSGEVYLFPGKPLIGVSEDN